ncbi:hypothetical protein EDC04DRAFT_1052466 [Pisolithus marmoratus]|nr:hypothetical protein EDC04DRAFT_1052466 [Pisolithus marmoratus]
MVRTPRLLQEYETSKPYTVRDFLSRARTSQVAASIVACELYYIPSPSFSFHEFLLVRTSEGPILIVERNPSNNRLRTFSSSGGLAKDTITVERFREHHEYWHPAGPAPVCKGAIRWHQPSPHLLDVAFFALAASTTFKHYNLYIRQCWWFSRITLAAMAGAFPSCSREGTTSFSRRRFSMFGSYKPSQVQKLVELHTRFRRELCRASLPPTRARFGVPNVFHCLTAFVPCTGRSL